MDLHYLEYIIEIANMHSISRAAENLFITQSTLTVCQRLRTDASAEARALQPAVRYGTGKNRKLFRWHHPAVGRCSLLPHHRQIL